MGGSERPLWPRWNEFDGPRGAGAETATGALDRQLEFAAELAQLRTAWFLGARNADADVPRVEVDVLPVQTECLPLSEAERQGDDPACTVAELGRLDQQALHG